MYTYTNYKYRVTDLTLNYLSQISYLLSSLHDSGIDEFWLKKLFEFSLKKQALGAVAISRNVSDDISEIIDPQNLILELDHATQEEFQSYQNVVLSIQRGEYQNKSIDIETLHDIHSKLDPHFPARFRTEKTVVTKGIWEHGIKKEVKFEVPLPKDNLDELIKQMLNWYDQNKDIINPLLLSAVLHYKIAELQPYQDGNGRLSRVMSKIIMTKHGYPEFLLIAHEYQLYLNRLRYFELISYDNVEDTYTQWLEFYLKAILSAAKEAVDDLCKLSGGSVDLENRKVTSLTPREREVLLLLTEKKQSNAAEIGRTLKISRQAANVMLRQLKDKNLLVSVGRGTASRYVLSSEK